MDGEPIPLGLVTSSIPDCETSRAFWENGGFVDLGPEYEIDLGPDCDTLLSATPSPKRARGQMPRRRFQKTGYMFRRGKRQSCWTGSFWEDVTTPDGRVKRSRRTVKLGLVSSMSKRAAAAAFQKYLNRVNESYVPPPKSGKILKDFIPVWLSQVVVLQADSSQRAIQSHLKTHILPKLGECALTELNTLCLQKFVTAIAAEGKSTKTITNVLHTLTSILNSARVFGIARGEFSRSDLKLPRRETKREIRSNTTEERAKIIFYAKEPYATMFCVFSIEALRSGEVLALKVTDLDFATKVFHIRHSLDSRTRKVKVTKTDASAKDLPMTPKLEERLLRFLQTWRSNPEGFLFTNQNGRPFSLGKVVEYGLWPAQDAAGIRRSGLHAFRHGVNSDLLDKGAPPAVTQRHLRHANMKTNLGFYSHVVGDAHRKAVEGLEERTEQFIRHLESGT
jgi:integrase